MPLEFSSIRFRTLQNPCLNILLFGEDLRDPFGGVWHIPIVSMRKAPYRGLLALLRKDGRISQDMEQLLDRLVDALGEPFTLSLSNTNEALFSSNEHWILNWDLFKLLCFPIRKYFPYSSGKPDCSS